MSEDSSRIVGEIPHDSLSDILLEGFPPESSTTTTTRNNLTGEATIDSRLVIKVAIPKIYDASDKERLTPEQERILVLGERITFLASDIGMLGELHKLQDALGQEYLGGVLKGQPADGHHYWERVGDGFTIRVWPVDDRQQTPYMTYPNAEVFYDSDYSTDNPSARIGVTTNQTRGYTRRPTFSQGNVGFSFDSQDFHGEDLRLTSLDALDKLDSLLPSEEDVRVTFGNLNAEVTERLTN